MNQTKSTSPLRIEKITISPKRMIYLKLWGPSHHTKWGMTRASIELQEARISEEKQITYDKPIRLPCDGSSALIADLISDYIIDGRRLNVEFKAQHSDSTSYQEEHPTEVIHRSSDIELESLLLTEFKNQKMSKTRILTSLTKKGYEIENTTLIQSLESLAEQEKITKEPAVHAASGTNYFLWGFP
ncbi:MAG: hypothetical protein JSV04_04130 [Candidatus Heimdallarchaeota archaeon]|nr:MAG: hypothetical protein JSV04_04130 [Candidatus Heimdallarchaeota archaeon]